jgi:hypothetical protein
MNISLSEAYETLNGDSLAAFSMMPDGQIVPWESVRTTIFNRVINVVPGSFNPLHSGHRWIYKESQTYPDLSLYEISVKRYDKPNYTLEELQNVLRNFNPWQESVIITNATLFVDKIKLIGTPEINFHIGFDAYDKVLNHGGAEYFESCNAFFFVYDRIIDGAFKSVADLQLPRNVRFGGTPPNHCMNMSSTAIRQGVV